MGGNFQFVKDRKSVNLGVWAAPGARDTIPLGGGLRPPPFGMVSLAGDPAWRAGFRLDSNLDSLKIGPPAGRKPAGGLILKLSRLESGRNPARKTDVRAGRTIA